MGRQFTQPTDTNHRWTLETWLVTALLLLFYTHFYIPVLDPVQDSLFTASSEGQTVAGQCVNALVWLLAGGLMMRRWSSVLQGFRAVPVTTLFVLFALASTLWSQAPALTFRKASFLVLTTAFGVYFARCFPLRRQLSIICVSGTIIATLSILFAILLPKYGLDHDVHEGAWVGVFTQKNVCAREMLFLLATLLSFAGASGAMRWVRRGGLLFVVAMILGTQSKTAWLMAAVLFASFAFLRLLRRMSTGLMLAISAGAFLTMAAAVAVALSSLPKLVILLGRDMTMSGRTQIWQAVMVAIAKRPWLGYGYSAFWLALKGESANIILALRWAVPAAHNGFLEIWLQLGTIGLSLFGLGFVRAWMTAAQGMRQEAFENAAWPISVMLLTLLYNLDESSLMQANDFLWVLYTIILTNLACARSEARMQTRAPYEALDAGFNSSPLMTSS